jgi:hypothetical protein
VTPIDSHTAQCGKSHVRDHTGFLGKSKQGNLIQAAEGDREEGGRLF